MTEITANYDETWKEAISLYFLEFIRFFYPEIYPKINWDMTPISLDKELEKITASSETPKRYADKLMKVWLLNNQEIWILIHMEVQSQYDSEFAQRMFIYNYRAFDLYHQPVISLAILGDESPSWRPNSYQYGFGNSEIKMTFKSVKLLDYQESELEQNNNLFAIIVMAHLKTKATTRNLTEREQGKWQLIRSLYQRGLSKYEIINLGKFIDKMMTLPPPLQLNFKTKLNQYEEELKMPFLSTLEEMALEQGLEQGTKSTTQKHIINLLQKRFGDLPNSLIQTINNLENIPLLEQLLLETISVNSLAEFEQLLNLN